MDFSALFGAATSGAGLIFGKSRKAAQAWQTAADTHGLKFEPATFWKGPKLSGSLSGNELTVDMKDRNTASAATRFRLAMPSLNRGLKLRKKGFWNSIGPRTTFGDKAFDNQVVVQGRHEFAVREFLTPERRTALQDFLASFKGAVVTDDEITLKTRGQVTNADDMIRTIDALVLVADALAEESRSTSIGGLAPEPAPASAPEPVLEPAQSEAPATEPADRSADEPERATQPDVEATASSAAVSETGNAPGVDEFCATVFAPGALSFAANQTFKAYQGERIVWTGTLESAAPFTFDFDFGSRGGIKAVLTILETEGAGSRNVEAVIGLPPGTEGLQDRIGQPVSFAGRLLKVDGLAKRVVIADAELV